MVQFTRNGGSSKSQADLLDLGLSFPSVFRFPTSLGTGASLAAGSGPEFLGSMATL